MNRKAHAACNFHCLIETEGLLKVTASHVHNVIISRKWCKIESLLLQCT